MKSQVNGGKRAPTTVFRRDASVRTAGVVTANLGGFKIADTSTTAQVGDIYRAETATVAGMVHKEYSVIEANTNDFTIASKLSPTLGDTFYILGPTTARVDNTGIPPAASANVTQLGGVAISLGAGPVDTGTQRVVKGNVAAETSANVSAATSSTTLLAASTTRLGASFFNDSTSIMYLKHGASASSTSFKVIIQPGGYYELPGPTIYGGIVTGIWVTATGSCRVSSS